MSPRLFLPAVSNIYPKLETKSICSLLFIIESHIETVDKNTAIKHQGHLQRFFLEGLLFILQVRSPATSYSLTKHCLLPESPT